MQVEDTAPPRLTMCLGNNGTTWMVDVAEIVAIDTISTRCEMIITWKSNPVLKYITIVPLSDMEANARLLRKTWTDYLRWRDGLPPE